MWEYILAGVLILLTAYYLSIRSKLSYWKNKGIAEEPGFFPFGSQCFWDLLLQRISFTQMTDAVYRNHPDAKIVGMYEGFGRPSVVIRDLDLVKQVLVKDFDQFCERKPLDGMIANPHSKNNNYLARMLTELRGKQWKRTRASLTPVFTSGKLKSMVPLIHKIADQCNDFLQQQCGKELEAKDIMKDFALDVIVSTGFGYDNDSFKNPDNVFKKNADLMVGKTITLKMLLTIILFLLSPKLLAWADLPFFDKNATDFFANLVRESIEQRKKDGIRRHDLIDVVLDVMDKKNKKAKEAKEGSNSDQEKEQSNSIDEDIWTDEEVKEILISNSLLMFLAGFDTVSTGASIMIYYLAKNQDIQEKLYQEIMNTAQEKEEGEDGDENVDYATIMKLPYLDMVFNESLRAFPLTHLERATVNDYKVPGTDIIIPKDVYVRIPMPGIMKDEKFYPNPDEFNPENFNEENKAKRNPYAFGGFGHGPRNCIAMRFATLEVKVAIARILTSFKILPCSKTVDKLVPDPKSRNSGPIGGIWFTVEKR